MAIVNGNSELNSVEAEVAAAGIIFIATVIPSDDSAIFDADQMA